MNIETNCSFQHISRVRNRYFLIKEEAKMRNVNLLIASISGFILLLVAADVFSQDWLQWRGTNRDGKVEEFAVPAKWPTELNQKWKVIVGTGDATPVMVDGKLYDGSRLQTTLGRTITMRSTFTIRRFRDDPLTPVDLIANNTMSAEMAAYFWMSIEKGTSILFCGGTASGKTTMLNALSLFVPTSFKIVSIEDTREINLPHENWIPGVTRLGFGEVINNRLIGEIDLFDLMKAALRQRPEYILVGEIRGKEAYVLFQAMASGHTTYSTVHADSAKSLIHRLEGKPIEIPRVMLQSLDIVLLQANVQLQDSNVRRCKQIVEVVDIDSFTQEVLTNEVFHWDSIEDKFVYSGKSYILENVRNQLGISKDEMKEEITRRVEILKWMHKNDIRAFKKFAEIVSSYTENPST